MKASQFLIIALLIISNSLFSQSDYDPLIDTTKQWNFLYEQLKDECGGNYDVIYEYTIAERFRGDTIINGLHYKMLEHCFNDSTFKNWPFYNYFFREDVDSQKVYILPSWDEEVLLYDFSLVAGDTLNFMGQLRKVDSVATKYIANKYRKVQYIFGYSFMSGFELIEGIGTKHGLYDHFEWFSGRTGSFPTYDLLCYSQNGETLYQNGEACFIYNDYTDLSTSTVIDDISIYPNPATEIINIRRSGRHGDAYLSVFSLDGRLIFQKCLENEIENIPTHNIPNGIYFLVIKQKNHKLVNEKIIINH